MSSRASLVPFIVGALIGVGVGILLGWVLLPPPATDLPLRSLRADIRADAALMAAQAYADTGDLGRAQSRVDALGFSGPETVAALAVELAAKNGRAGDVRALVELAQALQTHATAVAPSASATASARPNSTSTVGPSATTQSGRTSTATPLATPRPTPTRTPMPTFTARPAATSTPSRGFDLVSQEKICRPELEPALIQVWVVDVHGRPLAGAQVHVEWPGGSDRFVTGLKPEMGAGYADFEMSEGVTYSLRLGDLGEAVTGIVAEACTNEDGPTAGSWRLTFEQA